MAFPSDIGDSIFSFRIPWITMFLNCHCSFNSCPFTFSTFFCLCYNLCIGGIWNNIITILYINPWLCCASIMPNGVHFFFSFNAYSCSILFKHSFTYTWAHVNCFTSSSDCVNRADCISKNCLRCSFSTMRTFPFPSSIGEKERKIYHCLLRG